VLIAAPTGVLSALRRWTSQWSFKDEKSAGCTGSLSSRNGPKAIRIGALCVSLAGRLGHSRSSDFEAARTVDCWRRVIGPWWNREAIVGVSMSVSAMSYPMADSIKDAIPNVLKMLWDLENELRGAAQNSVVLRRDEYLSEARRHLDELLDWLDRQRRLVRRDLESRPRLLLRSHLAINIRSVNYASRRHSMACRCAASRHPRLASFWFLALASCKPATTNPEPISGFFCLRQSRVWRMVRLIGGG
jgi:hypothetical protein